MVYIQDDSDAFENVVGEKLLDNMNDNKMTWSIWRSRLYYVCVVLVGVLTALNGIKIGDFTIAIGVLTALETEFTS